MITMTDKYKTKCYGEIRILCIDGPNSTYPVIGVPLKANAPDVLTWTADGKHIHGSISDEGIDLIPLHPKYKVGQIWKLADGSIYKIVYIRPSQSLTQEQIQYPILGVKIASNDIKTHESHILYRTWTIDGKRNANVGPSAMDLSYRDSQLISTDNT